MNESGASDLRFDPSPVTPPDHHAGPCSRRHRRSPSRGRSAAGTRASHLVGRSTGAGRAHPGRTRECGPAPVDHGAPRTRGGRSGVVARGHRVGLACPLDRTAPAPRGARMDRRAGGCRRARREPHGVLVQRGALVRAPGAAPDPARTRVPCGAAHGRTITTWALAIGVVHVVVSIFLARTSRPGSVSASRWSS
jgi:hypothetical protein